MSLDLDDTIAAIASAAGGALRGIVRISGPQAVPIVRLVVVGDDSQSAFETPQASCRRVQLKLPRDLPPCPATLYLWPTDRSYTRQPAAELHLPGSPPLLEAALEAVCLAGARLARPGEFTLRAFLAGRMDLTQAEAVLGVIDAHSQAELTAALGQLAGGIAQPLAVLRNQLLNLLAHLEAGLDFAEEDIEFITSQDLQSQLAALAAQIADLAVRMSQRGRADQLPRVVLIGLPNAGKSSLFNALAGQSAAIVAPLAGTTRDHVVCRVLLEGIAVELVDTAGEEPTAPKTIAAAAQQLRHDQAAHADLLISCCDSSQPSVSSSAAQIRVWTKCDLALPAADPAAIATSSHTGLGIAVLRRRIAALVRAKPSDAAVVAGTADRCRDSLRHAAEALHRALAAAESHLGEELVAAEVRVALDELGRVVGAIYTDDVLDRVFSRFCIGK